MKEEAACRPRFTWSHPGGRGVVIIHIIINNCSTEIQCQNKDIKDKTEFLGHTIIFNKKKKKRTDTLFSDERYKYFFKN